MYKLRSQMYTKVLYNYTHYMHSIQHNELSILKLSTFVIFKYLLYLLSRFTLCTTCCIQILQVCGHVKENIKP